MAKSKVSEKEVEKTEPAVEPKKVEAVAAAAPKAAGLQDRVERLEKVVTLIANEIGLRLGEPLKSNFAHIIEFAQAPGQAKKK